MCLCRTFYVKNFLFFFCLLFPSLQVSPGDVLYPHVLTLLNFHGPYNPYNTPPTAITDGKLSMTLKTSQSLWFLMLLLAARTPAAVMQVSWMALKRFCLFVYFRHGTWHSFESTLEWIRCPTSTKMVGKNYVVVQQWPPHRHLSCHSKENIRGKVHPCFLWPLFVGLAMFPRMPCSMPSREVHEEEHVWTCNFQQFVGQKGEKFYDDCAAELRVETPWSIKLCDSVSCVGILEEGLPEVGQWQVTFPDSQADVVALTTLELSLLGIVF